MSAKELKNIFEKKFPDRKVIHAGKYKNGFIFVAPDKNLGELNDESNPIYFINSDGSKIERALIQNDPLGIGNALGNNKIF